jgi:hypothetical protein
MSNGQYKVDSKYRTNDLHKEGKGSTVIVHYEDGEESKVYENIQYPNAYVRKIKEGIEYDSGKISRIEVKKVNKATYI